jgi:drug/metabolite transporter (DMT)-like permease
VIGSYALGVGAALVAGAAYNAGQIAQKIAVNRLPPPAPGSGRLRSSLFVRLLASPIWLVGFAVVALVGTPLNLVAALWLGPAILPGLMSLGLVVLAIGAVTVAGEKLGAADLTGIALVMAGILLIGLSRLRVDVASEGMHETALVARLAGFTLCSTALAIALLAVAARAHGARGPLRAVAAGLFFSGSNLWLAVVMNALNHWLAGGPIRDGFGLAAIALAIICAASLVGVIVTQHAYRVGNASRVVPIQLVPQQIVPILAFLLVFRCPAPFASALPLAVAGAALVLSGAGLLSGRQVRAGMPKPRRRHGRRSGAAHARTP